MRYPSGVTDQYIYFVAVDSTDYVTRETGLSSFTVYRARNGAAAAAYTTPTVAEVSSSNMPGVYSLLLDEDMTIASGNDSEEVVLHITQASMAPVTIKYELYREKITQGETLTVSSGAGNAAVQSMANNVLTAAAINADAITAAKVASDVGTEIGTAVWATTTRLLTAGTNIALAKGTGVTGFNDLDAAGVRGAVGLASANLDTQIGDLPTNAELATALSAADDAVLAQIALVKAKTDNLPSDPADESLIIAATDAIMAAVGTVDTVVDAILVDTAEIGVAGAGLTAITSKTNNLPIDPADASVIAGRFDTLDTSVADLPTNAELTAALATADDAVLTQIGLVRAKTDSLSFTVAGQVDANIQYVNDTAVTGTGSPGSEWGP